MSERREFVRVPLRVEIQVRGEDRLTVQARTCDLSLRGVRVARLADVRAGQDCELRLLLGEGEGAVRVEILGRVVRCGEDDVGIEFLGLHGAESLDHLRRLVLHNAPDAHRAEEEIRGHRGLKPR